MAVDPAQFQRHPVGADIAFLEDVNRDAQFAADARGAHVMVAAIAEKHDVGDRQFAEQALELGRPVLQRSAIVDPAGQAPEQAVAAVEVDLVHPVPGSDQPLAEAAEKRSHQSLQQQDVAPARSLAGHKDDAGIALRPSHRLQFQNPHSALDFSGDLIVWPCIYLSILPNELIHPLVCQIFLDNLSIQSHRLYRRLIMTGTRPRAMRPLPAVEPKWK
ncbi:hypothetical protein NSU_4869 [Novosphingobium pentaromativorans US6-1]|uniref:Uncharacterized protein n=1 Tax=Novosphingobium pentaromativorans US6-1 TaxID=1088721 RepID=G6EKJ8_9SPHN|nr:hypothetical protein NSU_4869 [Novosphingobium pentaromativorans US6-1]